MRIEIRAKKYYSGKQTEQDTKKFIEYLEKKFETEKDKNKRRVILKTIKYLEIKIGKRKRSIPMKLYYIILYFIAFKNAILKR